MITYTCPICKRTTRQLPDQKVVCSRKDWVPKHYEQMKAKEKSEDE